MRPLPLVERLLSGVTPPRVTFYLGPVLLTWAAVLLYLNAAGGVLDRQERVRGRDFLAFYVHGRILAQGDGPLLYDPEHFRQVQEALATVSETRPRYYPVYPPATALLYAPLGALPYETALLLWWLTQAGCAALTAAWLLRVVRPPDAWRNALLIALGAWAPVFSTFLNGQFSWVLLLTVLAGFALHRRRQCFWAGCVFSLLLLKPQLAAVPALWLLLRRDWKALAGFAVGFLVQAAAVAALAGGDVLAAYVRNLDTCLEMTRVDQVTADHQHALAGILRNLLGPAWADASKLLHAPVALAAVVLLGRITANGRRAAAAGRVEDAALEYAAVLLATLLATPHLLTYDLVLLLPVLAWLWAPFGGGRPAGRVVLGAALYLAGAATPLYQLLGFSLVPAALAGGLLCLARWAAPVPNRRVLVDTAPKSAYA